MIANALGRLDCIVYMPYAIECDCKLVAAKPRNHVARPKTRLQAARRGYEQLISNLMSEAVIHHLESVEIKEQHSESISFAFLHVPDRALQPVHKQSAIGQAGQRVVK